MKKVFVLSLVMITGAMLTACGGRDTDTAAPGTKAPEKPRIALIMKSLANEFFLTMEEGARAHQAAHADQYDLFADGIKDELDVNRQIQLVEQMMDRRVNATVIAPADSKALVQVCHRALDAGIVVINIDNKFDDSVLAERGIKIPFVGPDNRKGARLAGEYLATRLQPGDPVAVIQGVPSAFNAIQRLEGFQDAIKAGLLNVVASQVGDWEMAKANRVMSAMITERPDIKAVLCANDSMALGAVAALRSAGKQEQVLVVGFDNISAAQELLRKGELLATVDQHADQLAVFGIEAALHLIQTGATPEDRETPVDLVTAESLK
ncbi:MAG TPA: sugar ABC transporter substrate-binding protein [Candidatus Hydrogenedentes bacterium]|nr:sugar ABC transporter substrate-binding protein [Candidatus Hydrogenedentota bacterium]